MWTLHPLCRYEEGWSHDTTATLKTFSPTTKANSSQQISVASLRWAIHHEGGTGSIHTQECETDWLQHYLRCQLCVLGGELLSVTWQTLRRACTGRWEWDRGNTPRFPLATSNRAKDWNVNVGLTYANIPAEKNEHDPRGGPRDLKTWFQRQVIHVSIQQTLKYLVCARYWFQALGIEEETKHAKIIASDVIR